MRQKQAVPVAPTLNRRQRAELVQQIAKDYPHRTHRDQIDWERAFEQHPEWRSLLNAEESLQPLYNFCRTLNLPMSTKGQLIQNIQLGDWYVRLYSLIEDDSFYLEWSLPTGDVGHKSYVNEDECLFSLHYCERIIFDYDPDVEQTAKPIVALRVKPENGHLKVSVGR